MRLTTIASLALAATAAVVACHSSTNKPAYTTTTGSELPPSLQNPSLSAPTPGPLPPPDDLQGTTGTTSNPPATMGNSSGGMDGNVARPDTYSPSGIGSDNELDRDRDRTSSGTMMHDRAGTDDVRAGKGDAGTKAYEPQLKR